MRILIIGTGYVGLVSGACFAEMGHNVICLDNDEKIINKLNAGEIPIYEPGLEYIIQRNVKEQRLSFSIDSSKSIKNSLMCFITVPTPTSFDGNADLQYVKRAIKTIAENLDEDKIIVCKSTVPIGTAAMLTTYIQNILKKRNVQYNVAVVSNPEFLKEGDAINDFLKPQRVIIGTKDVAAIKYLKELYAPFMLNHNRLIIMDSESAEMTKYAANAMLALRISFMNELSALCEKLGADITEIRKGIGSDTRIGNNFLYAGPGFGGCCFPKDVRALSAQASDLNCRSTIIDAINVVNEHQKAVIGNKILEYYKNKGGISNAKIAILGLSFKPNTDDVRESPAIFLVEQLLKLGAKEVRVYDPVAMDNARKIITDQKVTWCKNELLCAKDANALVLMTEWRQFHQLDLKSLLSEMNGNALFDSRNIFDPTEISKQGFDYISIGRRTIFADKNNT